MTERKMKVSDGIVKQFEEDLLRFYESQKEPFDSIIIDLSDIDYIEVVTMIYLIAFIEKLQKEQKDIRLILPLKKDVRNTMRIWRFPIVLKEVTGIPFSKFVVEEDLKYFGENTLAGDYYNRFAKNDEGLKELIKKGFFSLTSLPFKDKNDKTNAVIDLHIKWSDDAIKSILKKYLESYNGKKENIIPNRIIYECLTNAVRHSGAEKLIVGSFFDKKSKHLTISFWDNGDSIIQTLKEVQGKRPLRKKENNKVIESEDNINFSFFVKPEGDALSKRFYSSDEDPSQYSIPSELLLASFYPGVSRDPDGIDGYNPSPYLEDSDNKDAKLKSPGMGLTTLLNAAIDLMGGMVSVRAENYFVNIKKPIADVRKEYDSLKDKKFSSLYQAKIEKLPDAFPKLDGNMITIRLPLTNEK